MPVTIRTQPIDGEQWQKTTTTDPMEALRVSASSKGAKLMQSSVEARKSAFTPSTNGLVDAAMEAWNGHHHLVLRPDDVWLAIISQLGFFINAHAEELRHLFVNHEGQKPLKVTQFAHPDKADYAGFAIEMAAEVDRHVVDPELASWVIPNFSTTTDTDRVVGSVLLMGAMKHYFEYSFECETCGIPSVTLLGDRADWKELQDRIERIPRLTGEAVDFHHLLKPIARHMLLSFDEPTSDAVLKFWRVIASRERPRYSMSGGPSEYISGWITTFCFWTADGKRNAFHKDVHSAHKLDDVQYFPLEPEDKVDGWASVPVTVKWIDGGVLIEERKCRLIAGSIGMEPGDHAELGVLLDGLSLPPAETAEYAEEDGEAGSKSHRGSSGWRRHHDPETAKDRKMRQVQTPTVPEARAPLASAPLDAVKPRTGWWMIEELEKTGPKMPQVY